MIITKTISISIYLSFWIIVSAVSRFFVEEKQFTGSKFFEVENYKGVTVVVNLTDGHCIYCMGLLVDWNTNKAEGTFEYVVTTITCLKHEGILEISVRITRYYKYTIAY